jgi:hypothetical protein
VDLKGGTSGQILSKASNTDLDYTWITNDIGDITEVTAGTGITGGGTSGAVTITNSMATAIDAKGDLVPGTGADAFARLAVGANYGFLQADSAQSTGLAWNAGAWTSFTPTVTSQTGAPGSPSITGAYQRIGKTCIFRWRVNIVAQKGTAANAMFLTLPFSALASNRQVGVSVDLGVTGYLGSCFITDSDVTKCQAWQYNYTTWWETNYDIIGEITYEVA